MFVSSSWPGLSRPSTFFVAVDCKNVDARDNPGHDVKKQGALHRRADEPAALPSDLPHRWRGEMRGAAQRVGVAIALQEAAAGGCRLRLVGVEFRRHLRIKRLDRRVHEIAREHGVILAAAKSECDMAERVARR